jgi:hypothetical protein
MKNKFWPTATIILVVLSAIFIYSLRRLRIENATLRRDLHSYIDGYSTMIKDQELKTLPPIVFAHTYVNPGSFEEVWNEGTVYIRIHDSICLPCSSFVFDNIINNYTNSKRFKFHVLGSYKMNYNFLGDIKKLGLDKLAYTNSADDLGFIGADSLNVPYLFTMSDRKISTLMILSAAKDIEIEAYFKMIDRLLP